jgi:hypothetical protein
LISSTFFGFVIEYRGHRLAATPCPKDSLLGSWCFANDRYESLRNVEMVVLSFDEALHATLSALDLARRGRILTSKINVEHEVFSRTMKSTTGVENHLVYGISKKFDSV